jgi:curved DNA-binding protein CbpA
LSSRVKTPALRRYALLSLGADVELKVDSEGYLNLDDSDVRKAYFKISQKIHPDKLPHYSDATRAFQACVRAYELICKPELRVNESDDSRDEEEVGDKDDDVDAERKDGGAAAKKPRKPRCSPPCSCCRCAGDGSHSAGLCCTGAGLRPAARRRLLDRAGARAPDGGARTHAPARTS